MILRHKKTKRLYNFIGMKSDGINVSLILKLWYRNKSNKASSAKRTFTYSSFESIKELLNGFEELAGLEINQANFEAYENSGDDLLIK